MQGDLEGGDCPAPLDKVRHRGKQAGEMDAAPHPSSPLGRLAHGYQAGVASKEHSCFKDRHRIKLEGRLMVWGECLLPAHELQLLPWCEMGWYVLV